MARQPVREPPTISLPIYFDSVSSFNRNSSIFLSVFIWTELLHYSYVSWCNASHQVHCPDTRTNHPVTYTFFRIQIFATFNTAASHVFECCTSAVRFTCTQPVVWWSVLILSSNFHLVYQISRLRYLKITDLIVNQKFRHPELYFS